jgi:hypothetical protein
MAKPMTERSTHHTTFVIERTFAASPARVFAAWATPEAKAQWFRGPDEWKQTQRKLDFRVGGWEHLSGVWLKPAGAGTRLFFTEQAVFLDGFDDAGGREKGTRALLDKLEAALRRDSA